MNNNPKVYLIHLMIDNNLDPLSNKEVPLCDGWISKSQ